MVREPPLGQERRARGLWRRARPHCRAKTGSAANIVRRAKAARLWDRRPAKCLLGVAKECPRVGASAICGWHSRQRRGLTPATPFWRSTRRTSDHSPLGDTGGMIEWVSYDARQVPILSKWLVSTLGYPTSSTQMAKRLEATTPMKITTPPWSPAWRTDCRLHRDTGWSTLRERRALWTDHGVGCSHQPSAARNRADADAHSRIDVDSTRRVCLGCDFG